MLLPAQNIVDTQMKLSIRERLRQIAVGALFQALHFDLLLLNGRKQNHRDMAREDIRFDFSTKLLSRSARKHNVRHHHIDVRLLQNLERLLSRNHVEHVERTVQLARKRVQQRDVVFHQQDIVSLLVRCIGRDNNIFLFFQLRQHLYR